MVKKKINLAGAKERVIVVTLLLIFILTLTPVALLNSYFVLTGKMLFTPDINFAIAGYYFLHLIFSGFLVTYALVKHLPHKSWIPPTINLMIIPASTIGFLLHILNIGLPKIIDLLQFISVLCAAIILFKIATTGKFNRKVIQNE